MTLTCCHRLELSRVVDFEVLFWSVDLSPRAAAVFSVVASSSCWRQARAPARRVRMSPAERPSAILLDRIADVGFRHGDFRVVRSVENLKSMAGRIHSLGGGVALVAFAAVRVGGASPVATVPIPENLVSNVWAPETKLVSPAFPCAFVASHPLARTSRERSRRRWKNEVAHCANG